MKICLLIPVWGRQQVTTYCFENVAELCRVHPMTPHIIVSEDWAIDLCNEFGFAYTVTTNKPLGRKLNKGLHEALKTKWDWLATSGSDNFTLPELFNEYASHFETLPAFGLSTITMVDRSGKMKQVSNPYPFGAMRCVHRDVVEGVAFKNGEFVGLWDYHSNRGMDYSSQKRIEAKGYKITAVETETRLFDFKSGENINGFDSMVGKVGEWALPIELSQLLCKQSKSA